MASATTWSEWGDSNSRHPAPKAGALPTALHPVITVHLAKPLSIIQIFFHLSNVQIFLMTFFCIWSTIDISNKWYWRNFPLRKLNEAIDRFCALHPRLAIPGLMRYIVGANAVFFVLSLFAGDGTLNFLAMDPAAVLRGEIWRVVTYILLPTAYGLYNGIFLMISLMFYYWLGTTLERLWGSTKFTFYYVSGMLLTALASILVYLIDGIPLPIYGASYVNTAMFFAYAMTYPDAMVRVFMVIPIKMKWLAWLEALLYAVSVVRAAAMGLWGMALMPIVALLNLFVFFAPAFHRKADQVRARTRPQAVQFRRAVKDQQRQRGYNHKCSVCGKTDTDYPNMQFRYCSKCAGYHCYCEEHIFNHVHFTE